jgi:hypothetical protein
MTLGVRARRRGACRMRGSANRVKIACGDPARIGGFPMAYKFCVGETVTLERSANRNVPGGADEVVKQLPDTGREREYRIKSVAEPYERVALESELLKA